MSAFEWVAVALVVIGASARLTRLATFDEFPPVRWARDRYADWTDAHAPGWGLLAYCPYCASFWITAVVVITGWLSGWHGAWGTVWWLVCGTFAASYAAAIVQVHDGDDSDHVDALGSAPESIDL